MCHKVNYGFNMNTDGKRPLEYKDCDNNPSLKDLQGTTVVTWKNFNPIPVELWNDINHQGQAIMARIEFLPQI